MPRSTNSDWVMRSDSADAAWNVLCGLAKSRFPFPEPRQMEGRSCEGELYGHFFQSAPAKRSHPPLLLPYSAYRFPPRLPLLIDGPDGLDAKLAAK